MHPPLSSRLTTSCGALRRHGYRQLAGVHTLHTLQLVGDFSRRGVHFKALKLCINSRAPTSEIVAYSLHSTNMNARTTAKKPYWYRTGQAAGQVAIPVPVHFTAFGLAVGIYRPRQVATYAWAELLAGVQASEEERPDHRNETYRIAPNIPGSEA